MYNQMFLNPNKTIIVSQNEDGSIYWSRIGSLDIKADLAWNGGLDININGNLTGIRQFDNVIKPLNLSETDIIEMLEGNNNEQNYHTA